MPKQVTRRELLRYASLASVGGLLFAACQPKIIEVEKIVTQEVEKIVTQEVEKIVTQEVEKIVEQTVVVQKPVDQPVEITWWGYAIGIRYVPGKPWGSAAPEDWDNWQKESFMDLHPNAKVNIELLAHDESYFTKLDAALMAGTQPDIVMGPVSEASKYILRGLNSPFDDFISDKDMEDLHPKVREEISFDGKHYLWPWRLSYGGGVPVNGKILEERGVKDLLPQDEARKDWTYDDFLEICRACTYDSNGDGRNDVYGMALVGDWAFQDLQFQYGFGADFWNKDETEVIINSEEGIRGMQWMYDLEWKEKVALPGTASSIAGEVGNLWNQGKLAMFASQGAGGSSAAIEEAEANGTMEYIWCMPPSLPDKEPGVMTNIHGYYVFNQKDTNRTWWAHKYCEHLIRPEAIALSLQSGRPPARVSFWPQAAENPNLSVGIRMVDIMKSWGRRASSYTITFTLMQKYYSAIFSQQLGVKEGLDQFVAESNQILKDELEGKL